ncbi:KEOPS complex subunit Pcc1 [Natrarchaeobaculum aegyptiacum]|uniref:KEOPS complex Pcc1-like subunit n=1 Tax=Natrarchaeobaculum aegyptiacum TaxID=745377 RepID=A0A2Z2I186_9EURY|nr:KEOPS complex subunit Pcc1 [Natrarchaeobaculum aegyptiacum]ARS91494.1 KEOPS complex Pcc1-like subunit [Natrarchaeobaculum aegyptiacum]
MSTFEATLEFEYDDTSSASLVAESVAREVGEIDDERSRTTLERDDDRSQVRIQIDADDPIALRAALNTWFTLVDVAERTAAVGDATFDRP